MVLADFADYVDKRKECSMENRIYRGINLSDEFLNGE